MEATLPVTAELPTQQFSASVRKSSTPIVPIALFSVFVLGAIGIGIYTYSQIHSSTAEGMQRIATLDAIQAALLILSALTFGAIIYSLNRTLKSNDETIDRQTHEMEQTGAQLTHTKGELDYANTQLSHTVFQLQSANLQFDIITGELDSAKRETDAIFATVRQGLFLLGKDGTISAQTSGELKNIFQTKELARRNFPQLIRPLLPEKKHQTISDYFELLFDHRKNEKQLHKFNPLKRVELNFASPDGGFQPKHVEFSFQRIINNSAVSNVMVTVLDVSERVKLEDKLREGEVLREKQLELLLDLLQVDSAQLHGFLTEAGTSLENINAIFMEPGSGNTGQLQDKVQRVFRIAHNLKSQAASLSLHLFEKTIHQIEEQLNELRRTPTLANEDLLTVLVSISNLRAQLQDASTLIDKITGLRRSFTPPVNEMLGGKSDSSAFLKTPVAAAPKPSEELVRSVENLCKTVATRTGKQARIDWKLSANFDSLPAGHRKVLQNAIFQLVRNSIVHGIEAPDARARASKPACGCITVSLAPTTDPNLVQMVCRDDGAGLDADAIRARAIREKLIQESAVLSENDLYALIFEPGFSTVSATNEDGGRGVGLDIIRAEVVEDLHGEIQIGFSKGRFCEFGVIIPIA